MNDRSKKNIGKKKIDFKTALPISRLFPSIVTMIALCAGLTSIRYGFDHKWEQSVLLIILAAFLDGMDGRLARYLDVTSEFGAQIDSLVDFVNFGVAPAIIIYMWTLNSIHIHGVGWGFVLVFAICMAIRLARFNVLALKNEDSKENDLFFIGMPAPLCGILVVLPIILSFEFISLKFISNPWYIGVYTLIIAFAAASRIRTFSIKKIHIAQEYVTLVLACIGLVIAFLIIRPWITISALCAMYIVSIPISMIIYYYKKI
ncbi:MAG: CDP-diacylglycerol--serine O-phosphatidyltransferase [Alphaproteobacteria bacterium]|nr:CDP-diacylglycerol--serine O-phosphatidyltransferase [Alphaproteobacteria bacterium]